MIRVPFCNKGSASVVLASLFAAIELVLLEKSELSARLSSWNSLLNELLTNLFPNRIEDMNGFLI